MSFVTTSTYLNYYGSYAAKTPGKIARSSALAQMTLVQCYEWVGILDELELSLRLLKVEIPDLFANLNITAALQSSREYLYPARNGHPGIPPSAHRTVFPRLHENDTRSSEKLREILSEDFEVYDAELNRLYSRAHNLGK